MWTLYTIAKSHNVKTLWIVLSVTQEMMQWPTMSWTLSMAMTPSCWIWMVWVLGSRWVISVLSVLCVFICLSRFLSCFLTCFLSSYAFTGCNCLGLLNWWEFCNCVPFFLCCCSLCVWGGVCFLAFLLSCSTLVAICSQRLFLFCLFVCLSESVIDMCVLSLSVCLRVFWICDWYVCVLCLSVCLSLSLSLSLSLPPPSPHTPPSLSAFLSVSVSLSLLF